VLVDRAQGVIQVDAALGDDVRAGRQAGLADVQERDDLGMAVGNDVAREGREGCRPELPASTMVVTPAYTPPRSG